MNRIISDKEMFLLLAQIGIAGTSAAMFYQYGPLIIFIVILVSVIIVQSLKWTPYKKLKFIDDESGRKSPYQNLFIILLFIGGFCFSLVLCAYIIENNVWNIDYNLWVYLTSLLYFVVLIFLFMHRISLK